ncbi:hypothetical protein AAGW05_06280 [Arthrobacter sp. LAPM80]|uniref:hypothetical protein n=1 Tax=Arthrobacter sp. LAPM80 TaxID=3141788 RepID=UPI00398AFD1B
MAGGPWDFLIFPAALPLILAGVGLLAALLLLGSRQQPRHSYMMRAGIALMGAAALMGAYVAFFYEEIFPAATIVTTHPADPQWPILWA